jgi:hypothetical protein
MSELTPKYIENLQKAIKDSRIADHILYVTYPVIKDKRLLLKALDQIYDSIISTINALLQYDYIWKKIELSTDSKTNFETFLNKNSRLHNINQEETYEIIELVQLAESHRKSPIEFARREKVVILSDNLKTSLIDTDKLKKYLNLSKKLIEKAKVSISMQ